MQLTPSELLGELAAAPNHPYPYSYVREMLTRRDEMIPELLQILEDVAIHPEIYIEEAGMWKLPTFAAFLLAQWRETRAYRPLCATLSLPADTADYLWGDMVCEDLGRILASVYDGDDSPLREIMADPEAYEFIRGATIPHAYTCLIQAGKISRTEVETYAEWLFTTGLEREPSYAWSGWMILCVHLGFSRLTPHIEKMYAEGLVDNSFARLEDMLQDLDTGRATTEPERNRLVEDTVDETSWWCCWDKPMEPAKEKKPPPYNERVYTPAPKIGRNDPCPCNSGKKYKKCCGNG